MTLLYAPVLVPAFLITLLEMTEVVALVGGIALVAGAAVERLPPSYLLGPSAIVLFGFGVFLFRSTLRSYRRARAAKSGTGGFPEPHPVVQFGAGFSVGTVEATEAVIVLLALAAPGYGVAALVGALVAGGILVLLAWALHGQIRKIKVPVLKAGATALLFTFSIFWAGEALRVPWPGADLFLLPLFVAAVLIVRAAISLADHSAVPVETKT